MTRNPSVALALALALSGLGGRASAATFGTPLNVVPVGRGSLDLDMSSLGKTEDGRVIMPAGVYGPFQPGTACYAGTTGCTPKIEPVPSSGPGSFATTVGALQDIGAMQQKEAKADAAKSETPASQLPKEVSEEQKEFAQKDCAMFAGSCAGENGAPKNFAANSAPPPPDGATADAGDDGTQIGRDIGSNLIKPSGAGRDAGTSATSVADNRRQYDDINRQATTASSDELAGSLTYLKLRDFATGKTSPAKRALDESAARGAADPGAAIDDGANDRRRGNSRFFGR